MPLARRLESIATRMRMAVETIGRSSSTEEDLTPHIAALAVKLEDADVGVRTAAIRTLAKLAQVYADALRLPAARARVDALRRAHLLSMAASATGPGADAV